MGPTCPFAILGKLVGPRSAQQAEDRPGLARLQSALSTISLQVAVLEESGQRLKLKLI